MPDRRQLSFHPILHGAAGERDPRHEGADDRRQLGGVGELGERQREREREGDKGSRRTGASMHRLEQGRPEARSDGHGDGEETDRYREDPHEAEHRDRALGDDANDDGQDDQSHDVVGHRGTEDGPRLDGAERAQVAEHSGGDPDARRGERRPEEERGVAVVGEQLGGAEPAHHRHDHADHCDRHRRASDSTQLPQVHLEPHLEE